MLGGTNTPQTAMQKLVIWFYTQNIISCMDKNLRTKLLLLLLIEYVDFVKAPQFSTNKNIIWCGSRLQKK